MASSGKKKTTFSKLSRESRLRERRQDKAARKDARRREAERLGPQTLESPYADLPTPEPTTEDE